MTIKKKITATKAADPVKTPAVTVADAPSPAALQMAAFQEGVRLFTLKKFREACEAFGKVAKGPAINIADKARSYLQICERQLGQQSMQFNSAEDHFNYGVERLNARDIEQAKFHLGRALSMDPDADHILYTMALSCGLAGDGNAACENLKRAIELEPRNRILARQDPEFTALAHQYPALRSLLDSSGVAS